jgi:hypothetical protein
MDRLEYVVSYLANFEKFSSMAYEAREFKTLNISLSLLIWLYGIFAIVKNRRTLSLSERRKIVFTVLAFLVSIFVTVVIGNAWTGHHFIYPYLLALIVICQSTSSDFPGKTIFLIVYFGISVVIASQLYVAAPGQSSSWERYAIFEYLKQERVAENYVIVHLSLGTYYVSSLYGHPDQVSLQIRSLDEHTAAEIIKLSDTLKRGILCICVGPDCNARSLSKKFFENIQFAEESFGNNEWKVYRETHRY